MQKVTKYVAIAAGFLAALSAAINVLLERLESQFPNKTVEINNEDKG